VDVAFLGTTYNVKSGGSATYNVAGFSCSNISCHGGQTTPNWQSGTINVNTQCTACHAYGTTQYNSYNSGQHYLHLIDPNNGPQPKLICTNCHDTTKLTTSHFTKLNTSVMEGPASATILNTVNYNGTSCNPSCHGNETW
jgi:predicted CxxxxCH...CXXCH cytochrome family protein